MPSYGLIGKNLSHSYSSTLHELLGDTPYSLFSLDEAAFACFMQEKPFDGVNVTIPYKRLIIDYCDEIDETARAIGAINTVVHRDGRLFGHNTDAAGLRYLLAHLLPDLAGKTALILGNGGTACTARYVLAQMGAGKVLTASRNPGPEMLSYAEAAGRADVQLLVNTTPVGMYPNNGESPLSLANFSMLEAVADVVYNPSKTALMLEAEKCGVPAAGGLSMLVEQARVSSELFTGRPQPQSLTPKLVAELRRRLYNIVLIGMPGCGKSSLGLHLARQMGRTFVDLDDVIEEANGCAPGEIIEREGESAFRQKETLAAWETGKRNRLVIATGGGAILCAENIDALRQNGVLLWIDCPVENLATGQHRPLSKNAEDLQRLYTERQSLYQHAADGKIVYHTNFPQNLCQLKEKAEELLTF